MDLKKINKFENLGMWKFGNLEDTYNYLNKYFYNNNILYIKIKEKNHISFALNDYMIDIPIVSNRVHINELKDLASWMYRRGWPKPKYFLDKICRDER